MDDRLKHLYGPGSARDEASPEATDPAVPGTATDGDNRYSRVVPGGREACRPVRAPLRALIMPMIVFGIPALGFVASFFATSIACTDDDANIAKAKSDVAAIGQAINLFTIRVGRLPANVEELVSGPSTMMPQSPWRPLLPVIPYDGWGSPYAYRTVNRATGTFEVTSFGKDGIVGGAGSNADITFVGGRSGGR